MIITIVCLAALALTITCLATSPASARNRSRDVTRRLRHVARHPHQISSDDVECLILAAGLSADEARLVVEKAEARGIKPFTMLMWIQQHDACSLSLVVAADLGHHEILVHLAHDTVPDHDELVLFASLNGVSVPAPAVRTPSGATMAPAP